MGAINNAFNQVAGAVAGAGLIIKHAKETEESKMNTADNTALVARNQATAADAEGKAADAEFFKKGGLAEQMAAAGKNKEKAEREYNRAKNRKNGSAKTILQKRNDLMAAQEAEHVLNNKYQAFRDIKDRITGQKIYAATATKMAIDAKEKFEKHWGGTR